MVLNGVKNGIAISLQNNRKMSDHLCNDPIHNYYQKYFPRFIRIHKIFPSFHTNGTFIGTLSPTSLIFPSFHTNGHFIDTQSPIS